MSKEKYDYQDAKYTFRCPATGNLIRKGDRCVVLPGTNKLMSVEALNIFK